jgi:hypothetical protein
MAAQSQGVSRPNSARITQPIQYADGTTGTITWVKEPAAIKRVRRALSARNHRLVITREGSQQRIDLGLYAVIDADQTVIQKDADLTALARFLGVLADGEHIMPQPERGWLYYIGRYERVVVDGISANYARPITRTYTTEATARRAVAHLTDREGLVICAFDATSRVTADTDSEAA